MEFADHEHASDETLELYSMGRLSGGDLVDFEEHFLVCPSCQDRLATADAFRQGVRDEGRHSGQTPASFGLPRKKIYAALGLAAALVMLAGVAWRSLHRATGPTAIILLQSTRGPEEGAVSGASAGQPISLILDLTGLPTLSECALEIVDAAGRPVFQSTVSPKGNKLSATLARGLPAGSYFVRVYAPTRELLREYSLAVHR